MKRPIEVGGREGRDDPGSHQATVDCYLGLLRLATLPFRWMRSLKVCEWMAIAMVFITVCAVVAK